MELFAVNRRTVKAIAITFLSVGMLLPLVLSGLSGPAGHARLYALPGLFLSLGLIPQYLPASYGRFNPDGRWRRSLAVQFLYLCVLLLWCTDSSGTSWQMPDRLLFFQIGVLLLSAMLLLPPRSAALFFPGAQVCGFLRLLPGISAEEERLLLIALSVCCTVLAVLISVVRYRMWLEEFLLLGRLRRKVEQLRREKDDLEQTNRLLERMTQIDSQTGICNRFMFDKTIQREWQRCKRHAVPLSLMMIDIDCFKAYNDHYGHPAGDECIRKVAETLSGAVKRSSDLVARYGGDEFSVILPYMDAEESARLAASLKKKIELLRLPHAYSPVSDCVSISVGVHTAIPGDGQKAQELIQAADDALYETKRQCRARVLYGARTCPAAVVGAVLSEFEL